MIKVFSSSYFGKIVSPFSVFEFILDILIYEISRFFVVLSILKLLKTNLIYICVCHNVSLMAVNNMEFAIFNMLRMFHHQHINDEHVEQQQYNQHSP